MCTYQLAVRRANGDEIVENLDCETVLKQPAKVMMLVTEMLHHAINQDECERREAPQ